MAKNLIPEGLSEAWAFAAANAPDQADADDIVRMSDEGYDDWDIAGKAKVSKPLPDGMDIQALSTYTAMASGAGGIRRGPLPLRQRTLSRYQIDSATAVLPRQKKVTSGSCIPAKEALRRLIPSDSGQAYIDNR